MYNVRPRHILALSWSNFVKAVHGLCFTPFREGTFLIGGGGGVGVGRGGPGLRRGESFVLIFTNWGGPNLFCSQLGEGHTFFSNGKKLLDVAFIKVDSYFICQVSSLLGPTRRFSKMLNANDYTGVQSWGTIVVIGGYWHGESGAITHHCRHYSTQLAKTLEIAFSEGPKFQTFSREQAPGPPTLYPYPDFKVLSVFGGRVSRRFPD